MAFQPSAFQYNAFQQAVNRAERSGVMRLWVAQLTEAMNKKPEVVEVKDEKAPELLRYTTENDGSIVVQDAQKATKVAAKDIKARPLKAPKQLKRTVTPVTYQKLNLPTPTETAEYLYNSVALHTEEQLWAEEQVLVLLQKAILQKQIQEEDGIIIQAAAELLL